MMNIIFLSIIASAQTRSNLFTKPEPKVEKPKAQASPKTNPEAASGGNLPSEYIHRGAFSASENPIVVPSTKSGQRLAKAPIAAVIPGEILESVFAYADSKAPVRVLIKSGDLKGAVLLGEANLEKNSKRIIVTLKAMRTENSKDTWQLQASVLDLKGVLGLEGKLISSEGKYFAGEFVASAAAGYADSTVQRDQNVLGNYVEKPGFDTFTKKALATALGKTSERFGEKLKSVPEYSILEGPIPVQILITEQPKLAE